jgi:hypothetical protein
VLGERQVDTLKIDVEGHEIAVIQGLGSVVDRCRPTLLCEAIVPEVISGLHDMRRTLAYLAFKDDGGGKLVPADGAPGDMLLVPEERIDNARPLMRAGIA